MHQLFLVSELVENIVNELAVDSNLHIVIRGSRRPLNCLSRTCRALCDVSLDALWREMDTLVPLVRCMPDGVLSSQQTYHTEADWTRFHRYAARIRRLVIREIKVEGLLHISAPHKLPSLPGFEVLGILAEHVSLLGGDLLPNLRELVWDVNDPERSIYAPLLFSSCLVACRIWRENDIPVFLRALALRSPGVQLLHLPFSVDVDQISLPPSFHALRKLHVPMKEYSTLLDFASLQFLESLHWSPSSEQMLPRIHRSLTPYFPALRKLRLDVGPLDLHHVITFLHSIQTTSLRSFRLQIRCLQFEDPVEPFTLYKLIEALPRQLALEELSLSLLGCQRLNLPDSTCLDPLIQLPQLQSIFVEGIDPRLTDTCIQRLTFAWPKLKKFHIACEKYNKFRYVDT